MWMATSIKISWSNFHIKSYILKVFVIISLRLEILKRGPEEFGHPGVKSKIQIIKPRCCGL